LPVESRHVAGVVALVYRARWPHVAKVVLVNAGALAAFWGLMRNMWCFVIDSVCEEARGETPRFTQEAPR